MNWLRNLFVDSPEDSHRVLEAIQAKFSHFLSLLDQNNRVLKILSDMEEKSQGEFLFDINYIRASLLEIRAGVRGLIEEMVALGGQKYLPLTSVYSEINGKIDAILPGCRSLGSDDFTIPFDRLCRQRACSVGSKNAQLGELKSRLGLSVPDGFAVSGWAYKAFLDHNGLQDRISRRLDKLDPTELAHLVQVSDEIQAMVREAEIPQKLAGAIAAEADALSKRSGATQFSLRSSAIGEDTEYSFAGQYATFLNIGLDEVVENYRKVVASKFTPQAIYYYLSHDLSESELAMSVGCVVMLDVRASGVIYTQDPVHSGNDCVLVNSIYGLGKYLVDGTLTPDIFCVSREKKAVFRSQIAHKPVRLVLDKKSGGTACEDVPAEMQDQPSVSEEELLALTECALRIEEHYDAPQDIEWAIDQAGKLAILQTRPLHVVRPTKDDGPDVSSYELIVAEGDTVCPGAGGGPVYHVHTTGDLPGVPDGAVLVAPHTFPGLITVMPRASAIVTETGGAANHMATVAREYRIPTLGAVTSAMDLPQGQVVTVDATSAVIYAGVHQELIEARRPEYELFSDMAIFNMLEEILNYISPLNLIHPNSPNFVAEQCRTFHDITRFCHQRAIDEMFEGGLNIECKDQIAVRLKSNIPLKVNIIYVDQDYHTYAKQEWVEEEDVASEPMRQFWAGVKHQGWPSVPTINTRGFMSVLGTTVADGQREDFSETSFAILSQEYMILSLRMGYHFMTVEAMCTEEPGKNYVRMQYKEGGASVERRSRRIRLIRDVLSSVGFEHHSKGDFLDTRLAYQKSEVLYKRLHDLGRLTMLTKQLDMALSNANVTKWYTEDIIRKLGYDKPGKGSR